MNVSPLVWYSKSSPMPTGTQSSVPQTQQATCVRVRPAAGDAAAAASDECVRGPRWSNRSGCTAIWSRRRCRVGSILCNSCARTPRILAQRRSRAGAGDPLAVHTPSTRDDLVSDHLERSRSASGHRGHLPLTKPVARAARGQAVRRAAARRRALRGRSRAFSQRRTLAISPPNGCIYAVTRTTSGSIGADILSASWIGRRSISAQRINARNWRRCSSGTCPD